MSDIVAKGESKAGFTENIKNSKPESGLVVGIISAEPTAGLNIEYVCSRIDSIIRDTAHIQEAFETLKSIHGSGEIELKPYSPGDTAGEAKATAIGNIVLSRETTNQQILKLLEKMYDDLTGSEI